MSGLVAFTLSDNSEIYGIVNYLDKEGVASITVLSGAFSIVAQAKVTREYLQPSIRVSAKGFTFTE